MGGKHLRILAQTAWHGLQQGGFLLTELKNSYSVLWGLTRASGSLMKTCQNPGLITHTEKQKPQLLPTFSGHVRGPPTAQVKFHQEPK